MSPHIVRVVRILIFAGILFSIRWQHRKFLQATAESATWSDVMPTIRDVVPSTAEIRTAGASQPAQIHDSNKLFVGTVVRTSPSADRIIGFSGPSDVILVFDGDQKVQAARIHSSRDTREHVQLVRDDQTFLNSLIGRTQSDLLDLRDVDAVTGATLTSYAILESIQLRMSQVRDTESTASDARRPASLKFPEPPRLEDVRLLYPTATSLERESGSRFLWQVFDSEGRVAGSLLRSSPASDNVVGFQGPTDVLIAFDSGTSAAERGVTGIAIGVSYDNEPYVGYVRDDTYFRNLFSGRDVQALAAIDGGQVEGVSGATMTSQSAAKSIQSAAQAFVEEHGHGLKKDLSTSDEQKLSTSNRQADKDGVFATARNLAGSATLSNVATVAMTVFGVILGLTRLRGRRWLRICFQIVLIGWLGLINGDLVSQASLLGWSQNGVPWQHAFGLTMLTVAALLVPMITRRNVYCSHICPHGAVQQLIRRRLPWQWKLSPKVTRRLAMIPGILIAWVTAIGLLHLPFSPVDIEPFDAWLLTIAGTSTVVVAVVGLVVSVFVPMAYCRFGCPTGALLDFVGSAHGKAWGRRDSFALALMILGFLVSAFAPTG